MNDLFTPDGIAAPSAVPPVLNWTPAQLSGHTIDHLQDYLDRERYPFDPSIEGSPTCVIALDALTRLRRVSRELFATDIAAEPPVNASFISTIMGHISREAHAGRRIPLQADTDSADLAVTEGALRGAIRAAGDEDPAVLVGSCRIIGDIADPFSSVVVEVRISVRSGHHLLNAADQVRERVYRVLAEHSHLTIAAVNITVADLWGPPSSIGGTGGL